MWELGRPCSPKEVAELYPQPGPHVNTISTSFQSLEKKGYLTRTTDEHDARLKRLELTELGKKVHLDTIAVIDSAHDTMEAGITDEERRICFEVLEKICKNVEKITGGE